MANESVFARAKEAKGIGDLLGVAAHPIHHRRLKACPLCAGSFTFSYTDEQFQCWRASCGERGDVIDLAAAIWGCSKLDAALELAGEHKGDKREWKPRPKPPPRDEPDRRRLDTIADMLAGAVPARGTIVETYLAARGVDADAIDAAVERLLFNPRAIYFEPNGERAAMRLPAMIATVSAGGVDTGGLHCTYLAPDGARKVQREPAKKMWGPQANARGIPGGMLLIPPQPGGKLVVGEGIENSLILAGLAHAGAFACGSLDRLQGGMMRDDRGRVDWRKPAPDPQRPAATFRHDGPVLLALDGDMQEMTLEAGTRWERVISPDQRAQVSGLLATFWWERAGASDVRGLLPPIGLDVADWRAV